MTLFEYRYVAVSDSFSRLLVRALTLKSSTRSCGAQQCHCQRIGQTHSRQLFCFVRRSCPLELGDKNVERTEYSLSHGIRIALIKATRLGRLIASCSPTTGHTIRCPMLAFVDKYIVLEGAVSFGLSILSASRGSEIESRGHTEKLLNRYNSIVGD